MTGAAFVLTIALTAGLLAGCGDDTADVASPSSPSTPDSSTSSAPSADTHDSTAVEEAEPKPALDPEREPIEPGRHTFGDLSHPFSVEIGEPMVVATGPDWIDLASVDRDRRITFMVPTGWANPEVELRSDRLNAPLGELVGRADEMGIPMSGQMAWLDELDPRLVTSAGGGVAANGGEAESHDFTVTEAAVTAETGSGVAAIYELADHVVIVESGLFHRSWTIPHPASGDLWALVTDSSPEFVGSTSSWSDTMIRSLRTAGAPE